MDAGCLNLASGLLFLRGLIFGVRRGAPLSSELWQPRNQNMERSELGFPSHHTLRAALNPVCHLRES